MDHLVGRDHELRVLSEALTAAGHDGHLGVVVVDGVAGIGKSALVREAVAAVPADRLLFASGDEAERTVPFAAIEQLVAARPPADLPPALRDLAVPAAGPAPAPAQVGAALAGMIAAATSGTGPGAPESDGAATSPLVLVVDDVAQVDPPSQQALAFALRRVRHAPVLCLLTMQTGQMANLVDGLRQVLIERARDLRLTGLSAAALARLAASAHGVRPSGRAAERLREITEGSPLYARALLAELPADVLQGDLAPLPAPQSFRLFVLARLSQCPDDTRALVLAAAVLGKSSPLDAAARLAGLDTPSALAALEAAAGADLVAERPGTLRPRIAFTHPLVHAAVYHDIGVARRSDLHRRAADVVDDPRQALLHRATACRLPDDKVADELAAQAAADATHGRMSAAGDLLVEAARLTTDRAVRERRLADAVDATMHSGDLARASAHLESAGSLADQGMHRYLVGALRLLRGDYSAAEAELRQAWAALAAAERTADGEGGAAEAGRALDADSDLAARLGARQPMLACAISESMVGATLRHGRYPEATRWARLALRMREAAGIQAPPASHLPYVAVSAFTACGLLDEARAVVEAAGQIVAGAPGLAAVTRGCFQLIDGDLLGGRSTVTSAIDLLLRDDPAGPLVVTGLVRLALTEFSLGEWDTALSRVDLAEEIVTDGGLTGMMPWCALVRARLLAPRDLDAAARCLDDLRRVTALFPRGWHRESVQLGAALLAHARHQPAQVAEALAWFLDNPDADPVEPMETSWRGMYAEALAALGRLDEAETALAPLEAVAYTRRADVAVGAARARVAVSWALGRVDEATAAYERGMTLADDPPQPFELALLELAHGMGLLHRGRDMAAAGRVLGRVRARFAALGATNYLPWCDAELAALARAEGDPAQPRTGPAQPASAAVPPMISGRAPAAAVAAVGVPGQPGPLPLERLTRREREIAVHAAQGRSNQEIADTLVVSVRTVEYHLGNVYAKLGLRSRSQLAALLRPPGLAEPGGTTGDPPQRSG